MIMCVLLCYPVSIHMWQLLSTGRPISSYNTHPSLPSKLFPENESVLVFLMLY